MVLLLRQVTATQQDKQLIRSLGPKAQAKVPRLKITRTYSNEILPPKAVAPTSGLSTESSSIGSNDSRQGEVSTLEQTRLMQELEEARLKIRQLEETLQIKGGLQFTDETKHLSSPQSARSETLETSAFTENYDRVCSPDELSLSYDSWKLRSTLINLDVEEMCRCLAKAVLKHIQTSLQLRDFSSALPDFFEDFTRSQSSLLYADSHSPMPDLAVKAFEEAFNDSSVKVGVVPDVNSIYNFSKNLIVRCRMEREVSIACLVYLERLVTITGFRVSEVNWKRLLFTSLILASKTWDDDSFDNKHFAKVCTMYSLKQINQIEGVFLTLIDYALVLSGSDYAKYYFILRTYAEQTHRRFCAKALDVDTVRRLQNAAKVQIALKDLYREPLNRTR
jgi:hypothetical protein